MADRLNILTALEKQRLRDLFNTNYGTNYGQITQIRTFYQRLYPDIELDNDDAYMLIQNEFITPVLQERRETNVRFYTKINYTYNDSNDIADLFYSISDAYKTFDATSISLHYVDVDDPQNRLRSISLRIIDFVIPNPITGLFSPNYALFREALKNVEDGKIVGSDGVAKDEMRLVFDRFSLSRIRIAGNGKSDKIIFEVVGIKADPKQNNCAYKCLDALGCGNQVNVNKTNKLRDLEYLIKTIIDLSLPIDVIANSFTLKRPAKSIIETANINNTIKKITTTVKGRDTHYYCSAVSLIDDVDIVYLHKQTDKTALHTIVYDDINKHYDIVGSNIVVCDDVYITLDNKIIKNGNILFTPKQVNSNSNTNGVLKGEPLMELNYVFFDYETVVDWNKSSIMSEYSLSILVLNEKELKLLDEADEKNDANMVKRIREKSCKTFLGYNCSIQLIDWIIKNENNKKFVFIGFNNSSFDNFILLDAMLTNQNKYLDDYNLHDIFYNGNQLLNFQINGRHTTFDIRKHLVGSLKYNCKSFKIGCCSKKSLDHNYTQLLHEENKLIEYITGNDEVKEYNEYDVLATAVLYSRYRKALYDMKATKTYAIDLYSTKTIGSLIFKVFEDSVKDKELSFSKLSYQHYRDLRKYKIAGRVEMFNGVQKITERMASGDVCSLYPYVMCVKDVYYPVGEHTETNEYMGDDVIGFYYCDIDQSNLKGMNLPQIYARKTEIENDWSNNNNDILENYLISNVMIKLLKQHGCGVVIKEGFYFASKVKSCELFDFLLSFMGVKNQQDDYKRAGSDLYNPALRETVKLLSNSISGKVIEGLHADKTTSVDDVEDYLKISKKALSMNTITNIGNKIFVNYTVDEEMLIAKQKPIFLGVLIYDYAKEYMYNYSYSKIGLDKLVYTDTDATKVKYKDFMGWNKWVVDNNITVPHWKEVEKIDPRYKNHLIYEADSKVFGSFEDELDSMISVNNNKYVFYCLEKKSWLYSVDFNNEKERTKYRFKGLNRNAQILTGKEDILYCKIKENEEGESETIYKVKKGIEQEVNKFYVDNKKNSIGGNYGDEDYEPLNQVKFFEDIYKNGEAIVLCSSFRKIVKNSKRSVGHNEVEKFNNLMNHIQLKYQVKKIRLVR